MKNIEIKMFIDIKRYKGKYQIDENGNVKSLNYRGNTKTEHLLKPMKRGNGYLYVDLYDFDGKHHKENTHRLVAETFIPNPNNYPCINHKDENKQNNNINNLEWCTRSYNINYGNRNNNLNKEVWQYDLKGNFIKKWKSTMEIQRSLGYKNQNISSACRGKSRTAYNYIWKYKGDDTNRN